MCRRAVLPAFRQVFTCPNSSFTDLAEIVSRIEPAKVAAVDGELDVWKVGQEGGVGLTPLH